MYSFFIWVIALGNLLPPHVRYKITLSHHLVDRPAVSL